MTIKIPEAISRKLQAVDPEEDFTHTLCDRTEFMPYTLTILELEVLAKLYRYSEELCQLLEKSND
tara:strand:- start:536 stop:730 length:195 start_codon:yes stop_codon:yes gene_type:complete